MKDTISPKRNLHTISLLVANKPGVLVRIALTFARRGYNIDSLVVSPSVNERFSRMTITAQGDIDILDQIIKQANKLVDVVQVSEHTGEDALHRELMLVKIKCTAATKTAIKKIMKRYRSLTIEETQKTVTLEISGTTPELDQAEQTIKKYGIIEIVRSGKLVIAKGKETT